MMNLVPVRHHHETLNRQKNPLIRTRSVPSLFCIGLTPQGMCQGGFSCRSLNSGRYLNPS